jgi:polyisoprenoid-binding protein YceI
MIRLIFILTLGLLLNGPLHAATFQSVIAEKSSITFSYRQMGVPMEGKFKKFQAQLNLNTDKLAQAKGRIEIDLAQIDAGSSEADEEVTGKSWFHVAAHPKARFELKALKATGANSYDAVGQLTLKGQTRDMVAPIKLSPQGLLTGSFVIKRADYGIGEGMWAKFDIVANDITVKFQFNLK